MITGFQEPHKADPLVKGHLEAFPALAAGFIAGLILLVVPHASPWERLTTFSPAIIGREPLLSWGLPMVAVIMLHLALSVIYGFIISLYVMHFRELRAVFMGGLAGLVLYFLNYAVVAFLLPGMKGNEISVGFTHVVFGLIAAGVYRGLLRRKAVAQ